MQKAKKEQWHDQVPQLAWTDILALLLGHIQRDTEEQTSV